MAMIRKQIYLSERMDRQLKKEAKRRGISEAALIRERLEQAAQTEPSQAEDAAARRRFVKMLETARREALKHVGEETDWKFNRDDAYEERLANLSLDEIRPAVDDTKRDEFLHWLRERRRLIEAGPGTGWKFERGEIYEHRRNTARPDRH